MEQEPRAQIPPPSKYKQAGLTTRGPVMDWCILLNANSPRGSDDGDAWAFYPKQANYKILNKQYF